MEIPLSPNYDIGHSDPSSNMSSVRVKRPRSYSTISTEQPTLRRQPLSGLFSTPNTPAPPPAASPVLDENTLPRRPRARSRVQDSLIQHRASLAGFPGVPDSNPGSPAPPSSHIPNSHLPAYLRNEQQSRVTLHGGDLNVEMPGRPSSERAPSIVGAAVDRASVQFTDDDDPFNDRHHEENVVEVLEVIDPQVYTVANLANFANSVLVPPMGFSRKPVVVLSPRAPDPERASRYQDELDQHVDDILSKKDKMSRVLQGLWSFLKTRLYSHLRFCVVFWGAAIVFFLAKIINLHNDYTQGFWVEVSSQVVNGLFTVTGIGLIPYRTLDTYRVMRIWHYKLLTRKLRKKAGLPPLLDEDDLPDPMYDPNYRQQKELHRQQRKFHYSQSWYRPHGTTTHRAFPLRFAILICLLNDLNSVFQVNQLTGILIPLGFLSGMGAAVVIWKGGQKTRRTKEVAARLRAALDASSPDVLEKVASTTELPPSLSSTRHNEKQGIQRAPGIHIEPPIPERTDSVLIEEEMTVPTKEQVH
ncbi:hypothetical protein DL96DRAFT_1594868 [Flagelloscypha sp. PMI_526]|nr:hypothetical protein DL96DRAFT_1594868 [Flagelloscypha sp. PMI_526]